MSFRIDAFDNVTSGMSRGPKIWSYSSSTDTLAEILAADYFEEVKERLYRNDLIYVAASDDVELIRVTSENGDTPTTVVFVPASGGAPSDATYITQIPNVDLANEQALSLLASGIMKVATGTGVISIATPNVDYQVGSPALTSISALTTAADEMIYTTASNTYATTGLTSAGRALLDDATAGDQRNSLGLGTIATQNSNNVTITGGSITGITDLAIADGGTAASTNTAAINNLVSGASLTTATVSGADLVLIQDSSDSNNLKSVTVQSIADLTPGSVTSVSGTAGRITSSGGSTPVIDIDATYLGQSSITTLGAISSGTWASTAIPVTNGGTGLTTMTTAYAPVIAGTTATGNLQVASTGLATSGWVLTSNGASAVPSFQAPAAAGVTSVSGTTNRVTSTGGATPVIDISASYVGQSSITTLGTITTGVWTGTTVAVTSGGTGVATMTTAYAPVCAGTTATGALQVASTGLGTSGFVLTSTGASSLPSFQAVTVPAATTSGAAKFWLVAAGAGTSIISSFNVTSVTDTGPGDLAVTIATDFSTANWSGAVSTVSAETTSRCYYSAKAAGTCSVFNFNGGSKGDPTNYSLVGFGDQ